MTLSPVFRSEEAVRILEGEGIWNRLRPAARGQALAIANVRRDLPNVIDAKLVDLDAANAAAEGDAVGREFVQEFFFLILFRSVLEALGIHPDDLELCSELNFCIKGTITAADNLFDDQDKALLPLRVGEGSRFRSILQLLAFERLTSRSLQRGVSRRLISEASAAQFQQELLTRMASIGSLEGSEERGVADVLEPSRMIELVHRVRGGALFELAFIAPRMLESRIESDLLGRAERAIAKLGTAFQIVDDLTDFELDLARGSHNLLVSQVTHHGSRDERMRLSDFGTTTTAHGDPVVELFANSASAVLARGKREAKEALYELQEIGFWLSPDVSDHFVRAIVGLDGVERVRLL
jgi:hypothetical protein